MREIQPEVTRKVLNKVSEQILSKLDFLEFTLLDCYPDLVPYRAICRESVEQVFLHALWVPLLSLFRCKNLEQELALANQMVSRLNEPPSAFDIPRHLCLWDDVTNFNHIPYSPECKWAVIAKSPTQAPIFSIICYCRCFWLQTQNTYSQVC